ncbi:hypothetical protein KDL44_08345 [bacterium]|nr:hypothetical protein [bacterium]
MHSQVTNQVLQALIRQERGHRLALGLGLIGNTTLVVVAVSLCLLVSRRTLNYVLSIGLLSYALLSLLAGLTLGLLCWLVLNQLIMPSLQRDVSNQIRHSDGLPQLMEHPAPWELLPGGTFKNYLLRQQTDTEGLAQRLNFIAWRWNDLNRALGYQFIPSVPVWVTPVSVGIMVFVAVFLISMNLEFGMGIGLVPIAGLSIVMGQCRHLAALRALLQYFSDQS